MNFIKDMWYVAGWSHELGGTAPISRTIIGEPIALYRKADGTPVAIEDRCPHRHAPLSLGQVEGDDLRCMYHGLLFGSDGRCKHVPGSSLLPPDANARVFPVVERSSWIWVWMGDPALAVDTDVPHGTGLDGPESVRKAGALDDAADYKPIDDNLGGLSHLDFARETTPGTAIGARCAEDRPQDYDARQWTAQPTPVPGPSSDAK